MSAFEDIWIASDDEHPAAPVQLCVPCRGSGLCTSPVLPLLLLHHAECAAMHRRPRPLSLALDAQPQPSWRLDLAALQALAAPAQLVALPVMCI